MSFLEKLGLQRKKKPFSPFSSEKQAEQSSRSYFNKSNLFKLSLSLLFLVLVILLYPKSPLPEMAYQIGEPWRDDDLTAPFTYSILKDDDDIQSEIREIQETAPPVFLLNQSVPAQVSERIRNLFSDMEPVLNAYLDWQESRYHGSAHASDDSIFFMRALNRSEIFLEDAWEPLLEDYARARSSVLPDAEPGRDYAANRLPNILQQLLGRLLTDGIINMPVRPPETEEIIIRDLAARTDRNTRIQNVRTLQEAMAFVQSELQGTFEQPLLNSAMRIVNLVLEPNLIYSEEQTQNLIVERIEAITPTKGAVSTGQVIIRHGDIITPERFAMLQSLAHARAERASDIEIWKQYTGESILVFIISLIFFLYIYLFRRNIFDRNPMLLLVFMVVMLAYAIGAFVARIDELSPYVIPYAIAPILLTIIFDSRVGLMTTTMLALLAGLMFGNSFEFTTATITACSIGVFSVRDIKDRSQFYLTTPGLIFLTYAIVLLGFTLIKVGGWSTYMSNLLFLLGNMVGIWLTYPLILVIEKTFRITTDVTLLELSDTNQPILKKLMLEAPGSFHHSLQVANLAEAGAAEIGANALLCRVGALYHDIGKLEKPQYFIENQLSGNAHDKLKPSMSALIIKNHVDAGIRLAREVELPEVVIHFIRTHHGNSLIRFFYEKAINESGNEQEVREEDFRYDGPIPNSKETGILLLADGIEAASRSMSDHSYQKLENLVNRMVDDRLAEGQLNHCDLTLNDLTTIKATFSRILQGMYHGRVKYPGQDLEEENRNSSISSGSDKPAGRVQDPQKKRPT